MISTKGKLPATSWTVLWEISALLTEKDTLQLFKGTPCNKHFVIFSFNKRDLAHSFTESMTALAFQI